MKTYVFVVILAVSCLLAKTKDTPIEQYSRNVNARIIEGTPAKVGQFPWQVFIRTKNQNNKRYICGGSLIEHQWVLTAAHCMTGVKEVTLKLGGVTTSTSEIVISEGLSHVIHPKYDSQYAHNDIALVRLPRSIEYSSTIHPVALPQAYERLGVNIPVIVSGFGRVGENITGNQILYYIKLTTIRNAECAKIYGDSVIISSTLCALGESGSNTCSGDSGGPLVQYDNKGVATQVGVASFVNGNGCEQGGPAGFVRTALFVDWIHEVTNIK